MSEPGLTELIEDLDPTQKPSRKPRVTTPQLLARLRAHHTPPPSKTPQADLSGGDLITEVGINGDDTQTRADAIHVGYTQNSGRILTGYELKVLRGDWTRELNKPGKADRWADACHSWVIVAPDTTVVPPEQIPHGWGLMVINPRAARRMTIVVKPAVKRNHNPPWWAIRSIMARQNTLQARTVAEQVRAKLQAIQAEQERRPTVKPPRTTDDWAAETALAIYREFEDAGLHLGRNGDRSLHTVTAELLQRNAALLGPAVTDARLRAIKQEIVGSWGSLDRVQQTLNDLRRLANQLGDPE